MTLDFSKFHLLIINSIRIRIPSSWRFFNFVNMMSNTELTIEAYASITFDQKVISTCCYYDSYYNYFNFKWWPNYVFLFALLYPWAMSWICKIDDNWYIFLHILCCCWHPSFKIEAVLHHFIRNQVLHLDFNRIPYTGFLRGYWNSRADFMNCCLYCQFY